MDIKKEHKEMVARLLKTGEDTINDLTPDAAELLHMAVGISGEVSELNEPLYECAVCGHSIKDKEENILEEMGDICFFIEGAMQILNRYSSTNFSTTTLIDKIELSTTRLAITLTCMEDSTSLKEVFCSEFQILSISAGQFLDVVKKHAIYAKDLDLEAAMYQLGMIVYSFRFLIKFLGNTLDKCLEHNINKLEKSNKARYKDGYSNEAAQKRADKK